MHTISNTVFIFALSSYLIHKIKQTKMKTPNTVAEYIKALNTSTVKEFTQLQKSALYSQVILNSETGLFEEFQF